MITIETGWITGLRFELEVYHECPDHDDLDSGERTGEAAASALGAMGRSAGRKAVSPAQASSSPMDFSLEAPEADL